MHLALLSAALALALSGVHAQQLLPTFTPCITNCLEQAITKDLSSCSTPGVQCLCANAKTQQDVLSCLQQQCTTQDVGAVQAIIAAECAPAANSTSTHGEVPSWSLSTRTRRSSETHSWGKASASFSATTGIVSSTHLSSIAATSASATSLANSTSLTSTNSATTLALSSSSSSLDASSTTPSAAQAGANAAARVGQDAIRVYAVLWAVFGLGGVAIW